MVIHGNLRFSFFIATHSSNDQDGYGVKTANEEIEREDSGGLCARAMMWSSEFHGNSWLGSIAYKNSVFGDGISTPTHSFFLYMSKTKESSFFPGDKF